VNFTLRQLRYFDMLAQHRHFGRAADACSISQPALSVQIKELEATLGSALFERGAREVRLTTVGDALLPQVRDILASVDELSNLARANSGRALARLRIGIIPTMAPYLLPKLMQMLADQNPLLDVHVRETLTNRLLRELSEGRLDTAILALPISEPSLTEVALFDEDFVLVRPLQDQYLPTPKLSELQNLRLLLLEEGHCFRDQALSFCNLPHEGLDGSSLTTLVQMVASGMGVTLIPKMAVDVETRLAEVSVAHFKDASIGRTVGMVWRKTNPLSDQLMAIAEQIKERVHTT
ncbi:MAG: LysR substrate-binding domain-containing protein, partial [Pseudomonadota bacterium]